MRRKFTSGAEIVAPSRYAIDFTHSVDRTVQSGKDDADINVIVKRFGLTGQIKPNNVQPFYGDFSGVDSYHEAQNMLVAAKQAFAELPSHVRERFANDPGNLIRFVSDDKNLEEARKLGLLRPQEAAPAPMRVEVVPPAAARAGAQGAPPAEGPGGGASPA